MVWANLSTDRERDFKLLVELKSDSNVRLLDALRGLSNHSYLFRSTEKSDHLPLFLERPFAAGEVSVSRGWKRFIGRPREAG